MQDCAMTDPTQASAQSYAPDPRNDTVEIYVNGQFFARDKAMVPVFDSGFILGDGIWEGLRLVKGRLLAVDEHMARLYEGANSIQLDIGMDRDALVGEIWKTLRHNDMEDGAHIRLMISRGVKSTPNQDPRFVLGSATIVIVAEYKQPNAALKARGLKLLTSTIRCSTG